MSFRAGLGMAAKRNALASAGNPTLPFQPIASHLTDNYHRTEYKLNDRGTYDVKVYTASNVLGQGSMVTFVIMAMNCWIP
jgi:hypothetical protein